MHFLVLSALIVAAVAAPQGYNAPAPFQSNGIRGGGAAPPPLPPPPPPPVTCPPGEILNVDGNCARPQVTRNIFVFAAPEQRRELLPLPPIPEPKVDFNIVFIRTPEGQEDQEPIVIPPPQQRTLVYVLSKQSELGGPKIIEVPAQPGQNPEVYFVNYRDGENPQLPGGIDLQTALSAAAQTGQVVGAGVPSLGGGAPAGGFSGFNGGSPGGFGGAPGVGLPIGGGAPAGGFGGFNGGSAGGFGDVRGTEYNPPQPTPSQQYGAP